MDRFRLLIGLMLLFLGVNVLSMLAPGVTVLYASRVVAALVSGTLTAVAMLYAKEVSSPEQTARAISAVYAGFSVAAVAGVPIGTAVCHALGWRATFGVILAMGLVLLPVLALIFLVCLVPTGMVSLGSITMAALYPVLTLIYSYYRGLAAGDMAVCFVGALIMSILVIYMHRSNIKRIREGKEYRFGKKHQK